ncbi:psbP domain-containing protein 7, chloroplastic [Iris pallida]|uniref:PsbP domain-containing protein 7, chloroplastic n=1 Tax=Iris pallida TaxID=29817 RepID=A0AAX6FL88_IRIPA|nr:psbP domain-containing protein 7, chloroplastic [Iris pallida]
MATQSIGGAARASGSSPPHPTPRCSRARCSVGGGEEFSAPLAAVFRRRLLTGVGTASLVAVGANFGGLTSFLLGFSPDFARDLRLDVLYPIRGFTRCLAPNYGFEFIYPANWVGDQTLLYRTVDYAESQRISGRTTTGKPRNEPIVAYGPPGTKGELNVSVIVSSVAPDFSIEAFGGPKEVGEAVLKKIAGSRRGPETTATLVEATLREDTLNKVNYYKLEFKVESPTFRRHNVAVCSARNGKLFTLNAQAPESTWQKVQREFYAIADSFNLTEK